MRDNSNGALLASLGEGQNREPSAVTEGPRGDAASTTSSVPSGTDARQMTLPIFPPDEPEAADTYTGADLALTADAWAATGYTAAVEYFAASGQEFTCDAVRGVVGDPASNQLLGAVFSHAATCRITVEVCDDILGSRRKTRHIPQGPSEWTWCGIHWRPLYRYAVADLVALADLPTVGRACPDCIGKLYAVHGLTTPALEGAA